MGFMLTATIYAFGTAKMKTRDVKRLADLRQISKALELYYDANGSYPVGGYDSRPDFGGDWNVFTNFLSPVHIISVSIDPTNQSGDGAMCGDCGEYRYEGYSDSYILSTYLAVDSDQKTGSNAFGPYYSITSNCVPVDFFSCN